MVALRFDNPFHDLWVTEILDSNAFVQMFSPLLVTDAEELFSSGHVVVRGRQGSGKSMLLNLLQTSTRVAYANSRTEFPAPPKQRAFISAGVQLTKESASLVASRADELPEDQRIKLVAANFADYLNSLLSSDLIRNILFLAVEQEKNSEILPEVRINLGVKTQQRFIDLIYQSEAWQGFVPKGLQSLKDIGTALEGRIRSYKSYFNFQTDEFPRELISSRSPAGEPMAELADALRESGVMPKNTLVLLRIDQHEELFELERHTNLGTVFRQVINSALAKRDPRVAYRIGTRHYAWDRDVTAWGSGAPLEAMRDYSIIDLDQILKRGEHTRAWKFPLFAADVVSKRLDAAGLRFQGNSMEIMFGKSLEPADRARRYVGDVKCTIQFEEVWAPAWKAYIEKLWNDGDPLEAKFGEVWLRQQTQVRHKVASDGTLAHETPWRKSKWWVKERNEVALMQLAGSRQQALIWSGERQIIDLSGHNILAFMTICKSVWATWQRRNPADAEKRAALPNFSVDDQVIGISEASQIWFKKIQVGLEANQRTRLISGLGQWFRRRMLSDKALSNPGHSGFSLLESELLSNHFLVPIVKACRDHGDLMESQHTTKEQNQAQRLKWYLHPLLCPLFRIPHIRTKEPIYTSLHELQDIYNSQRRAGPIADDAIKAESEGQLGLPGF